LTAVGHRGGATPARRPVKVSALVTTPERELDARELSRPHIAGNSLGGWIAIDGSGSTARRVDESGNPL
jgi:hypothetical protein